MSRPSKRQYADICIKGDYLSLKQTCRILNLGEDGVQSLGKSRTLDTLKLCNGDDNKNGRNTVIVYSTESVVAQLRKRIEEGNSTANRTEPLFTKKNLEGYVAPTEIDYNNKYTMEDAYQVFIREVEAPCTWDMFESLFRPKNGHPIVLSSFQIAHEGLKKNYVADAVLRSFIEHINKRIAELRDNKEFAPANRETLPIANENEYVTKRELNEILETTLQKQCGIHKQESLLSALQESGETI